MWLKVHPSVEVVTRKRSKTYANGITEGAPAAVQVADRWHLSKNLLEALEKLLKQQPQQKLQRTGQRFCRAFTIGDDKTMRRYPKDSFVPFSKILDAARHEIEK